MEKIAREQIKQIDIVGYYKYLNAVPEYIAAYINNDNTDKAKKGEFIVSIHYERLYGEKEKETPARIILYRIIDGLTVMNSAVKAFYKEQKYEFSRLEFDQNPKETYLTKCEKEYYLNPFLFRTNDIDHRLFASCALDLGKEIGRLIFFRELVTGEKEELEEININKRLDLLATYFEPKTEYKTLSIRGKSRILEKIMGEKSEWLRKKISERLRTGKD